MVGMHMLMAPVLDLKSVIEVTDLLLLASLAAAAAQLVMVLFFFTGDDTHASGVFSKACVSQPQGPAAPAAVVSKCLRLRVRR